MVSNRLKGWRDDFATVKRQRDGFGAFRKETGCHPASSSPTSSTDYKYLIIHTGAHIVLLLLRTGPYRPTFTTGVLICMGN
jgi:hypothetical protein